MCTGISLQASDGSVVVARTVEWALSDAHHDRFALFPRAHRFTALTPDGPTGMRWEGRHGFVTVTAYGQPYGPDGLNEVGLYVGVYYFPGYCSLTPYDPADASRSASVGDFMQWLLSSFSTVAEVRAHLGDVRVVQVEDPRFGGAPLPFHWKIADPTGEAIVVEIVDGGRVAVYDAFLGVITNAPSYDWHLTNLRNYVGLSPAPSAPLTIDGVRLAPFGSGSGFLGLPGDFTPPSRFVRAAALTACARPLDDAADAVFEAFRILDSFNIPVGVTGPAGHTATDIVSATQVTTVSDLANRAVYFHTMANRQVRRIDLGHIDFATVQHQVLESGAGRRQAVLDIVPT
ncbi:MAG: linear amide C-N hydrolase [Acidimicrobiales bacterium]